MTFEADKPIFCTLRIADEHLRVRAFRDGFQKSASPNFASSAPPMNISCSAFNRVRAFQDGFQNLISHKSAADAFVVAVSVDFALRITVIRQAGFCIHQACAINISAAFNRVRAFQDGFQNLISRKSTADAFAAALVMSISPIAFNRVRALRDGFLKPTSRKSAADAFADALVMSISPTAFNRVRVFRDDVLKPANHSFASQTPPPTELNSL